MEGDRDERDDRRSGVITQKWGLSIGVVVLIVAGIAANLKMMSDADQRYARVDEKLIAIKDDMREIKTVLSTITSTMHSEIQSLRQEQSESSKQFERMISELRERISILEANRSQ